MTSGRVTIAVPGEPFAKGRPRFTARGKVYTDGKSRTHEELLGLHFNLAISEPFPSNVYVEATFYRSTKQRIDVDNLMKAVLDAATGIAWADDSQVTSIKARLHLDKENPRTEVTFEEDLDSTMPRGSVVDLTGACERCGKSFSYRSYASRPAMRFCSRECVRADRGAGVCSHCDGEFRRASATQKYCSRECAFAARHARRLTSLPDCLECGKKLRRKGAVLCRECWLAPGNRHMRKQDWLKREAA